MDKTSGRFHNKDIGTLISNDVTEMEDSLMFEKGMSSSGVNNYVKYLRAVCNYAKSKRSVKFLDFPEFEVVEPDGREETLTAKQARDLIQHLDPLRADMVEMSLATGQRNGNITLMRWDWIHPKHTNVLVPALSTKNGERLMLVLNKDAKRILAKRLEIQSRVRDEHPSFSTEYVFAQIDPKGKSFGKPFARTSVTNKTWKQACAKAGLPSTTRFHTLRHTFASWHSGVGTTVEELMLAGGWKSAAAARRYIHRDEADTVRISARTEGMLYQ
jgi:integrase